MGEFGLRAVDKVRVCQSQGPEEFVEKVVLNPEDVLLKVQEAETLDFNDERHLSFWRVVLTAFTVHRALHIDFIATFMKYDESTLFLKLFLIFKYC